MKKQLFKLAFVAVMAAQLSSCAESKEDALNKQIEKTMAEHQSIGLAVTAVKDGEIIYSNSFGYKDLEAQTPLEEGDMFRIASISKSFAATALMQMAEQGKINIDEEVSKYVGFPVVNPKYPDTKITLKMLLAHCSSMNDSEGYFTLNAINPDSTATYAGAYNDYEPGTQYEYCNLGYNTLGTILERVSGERYDQYIINHILKPVGVTGGYLVADLDSTKLVNLYSFQPDSTFKHSPAAYMQRADFLDRYVQGVTTPAFSPTGGMKISARDLAKVMAMHMNLGAVNDSVRVISEESAKAMQSIVSHPSEAGDLGYGFAIETTENLIPGLVMIGHTGSAYGVYTSMFWDAERKFGIVTMTNGCNPVLENSFITLSRDITNDVYNGIIK